VRCWGAGAQGQLGTGNTNTLYSPPPTDFISDATQSAAGGEHTCVRLSDGTVKCVGSNAFGQLGIGCTTSNLTSPGDAVMNLSGVARVVAGGSHTCALLSDATVRCWGDDRSGQTGASQLLIPNNKYCQATPIRVITGITVLSLGGNHTCAHASDTRCWGSGASGQLGIGVVGTDYPAPTTGPALINTVQLVSGTAHTCARLSSAGVSCWGANTFGELGSGSNTSSANAVGITQALWVGAMVSGTSAVELAAGGNHTCARRSDGAVLCWGRNLDGELGDGTTMNRNVPTPVVWQAP
jgi:alpha-tubulin suppressor-like RCC1 family protein